MLYSANTRLAVFHSLACLFENHHPTHVHCVHCCTRSHPLPSHKLTSHLPQPTCDAPTPDQAENTRREHASTLTRPHTVVLADAVVRTHDEWCHMQQTTTLLHACDFRHLTPSRVASAVQIGRALIVWRATVSRRSASGSISASTAPVALQALPVWHSNLTSHSRSHRVIRRLSRVRRSWISDTKRRGDYRHPPDYERAFLAHGMGTECAFQSRRTIKGLGTEYHSDDGVCSAALCSTDARSARLSNQGGQRWAQSGSGPDSARVHHCTPPRSIGRPREPGRPLGNRSGRRLSSISGVVPRHACALACSCSVRTRLDVSLSKSSWKAITGPIEAPQTTRRVPPPDTCTFGHCHSRSYSPATSHSRP